jgi:hypothetical protein
MADMFTHEASAFTRNAWRLAFPLVRAGIRKGLRIDREPPPGIPEAIVDFRDSLAGRSAFRWVVEVYRRHRGRSAAVGG